MQASIATENYEFIRRLVYERSRINLGPDKMDLVRSRVQKRLRALGLDSFDSYCRLLESPSGEEEVTALLDVISTNVTHFFREMEHFQFLRETFLPEYDTGQKPFSGEPLRVWSAACSSGQEPYSLAMLLADFFRQQRDRPWRISASDISTRMLALAQAGIYPSDQVKLPTADWLRAYFQKGAGSCEGHYRVKASLRERVAFRHLDLFEWPYPWPEKFHIIFCRNVMIYFDRQTQEQLVMHLAAQLEPAGYLFVGHSESLIGIRHDLKHLRPSIYQKSPTARELAPATP